MLLQKSCVKVSILFLWLSDRCPTYLTGTYLTWGTHSVTRVDYQRLEPCKVSNEYLEYPCYSTLRKGPYALIRDFCLPRCTTKTVRTKKPESITAVGAPTEATIIVRLPSQWVRYDMKNFEFFNSVYGSESEQEAPHSFVQSPYITERRKCINRAKTIFEPAKNSVLVT